MENRKRARFKLLVMALLCVSPVLASWALYVARVPLGQKSVGELLPTRPFVSAAASDWPHGKWVLAGVSRESCDSACQGRLFALRQIHVAQGEDAGRLQRVLVSSSAQSAPAGTRLVRVAPARLPEREAGLYLIDPLGNQVMFYADRTDPTKLIREVTRILKTNNGLG
jgi:hypothetical protein